MRQSKQRQLRGAVQVNGQSWFGARGWTLLCHPPLAGRAECGKVSKDSLEARRGTRTVVVRSAWQEAFATAGGCAKRSRAWAALTRSTDRVLHHLETTGGPV
ncbi:MAG: hypothetical protein LBD24_03170 [Spirochaetaceae bacterium]|nr:hypothetical protein [Spirochaetaceae bacterium]